MAAQEHRSSLPRRAEAEFRRQGFAILAPMAPGFRYDFVAERHGHEVPVLVLDYAKVVPVTRVQRFHEYLRGAERQQGVIVANQRGFSPQAWRFVQDHPHPRVTLQSGPEGPAEQPLRQIAVFMAKGGVGKTTVAMTLAAQLAAFGYDAAIADFDANQQISLMLGENGLRVDAPGLGGTLDVFGKQDWLAHQSAGGTLVVHDFPQVLDGDARRLLQGMDTVVVPVSLADGLAIGKDGQNLRHTVQSVRRHAHQADVFAVANLWSSELAGSVAHKLYMELRHAFRDDHVALLDPAECAIPRTAQLSLFWDALVAARDDAGRLSVGGEDGPERFWQHMGKLARCVLGSLGLERRQ